MVDRPRLRGGERGPARAGTSDGVGSLLSDQEGEDIRDLVEWAGAQPWSTGAVGLIGVSYLALSQWKAAALQPPSLRAIVPWEGFTNAYRDLVRPGGIAEIGFVRIWSWASSGPGCATPSVPPPGTDHCATNGGSSSFPSCAGSPCPR